MSERDNPIPRDETPEQQIHEYYDNILSSLIDGIVVVDTEFRVMTFSATAEQMMGLKAESVLGKKLADIFGEESEIHKLVQGTLQTGRSYSDSNFSVHGYFGDRWDIGLATSPLRDRTGSTVGAVLVFRDLSRIKTLEERLRKGERLASLGILSAGMAHEIKNPLGGIRGATQLLRAELGDASPLSEYGDIIIREVDRLNKIVQDLLEYARPPVLKLQAVNLHRILDRVVSLVRLEVPEEKLRFVRNLDPSLPEILGDPDQLIQVFLNLLKNGIDAMGGSGVFSLTTRLLPGYTVEPRDAVKRGMISVDVEDEGCGMNPEEMARAFDPFYTRKPKGVGLGLAVCHRIVEEHGGKIDVTSTPGKGTCFRVSLPFVIRGKTGEAGK